MSARLHARLTHEPLSLEAAHAFVADPAAGATVVFTGTVRNHADGRAVVGLTYEAFSERAQPQLTALVAQVAAEWPQVTAVWAEHRVGALGIGEPSVVVAVSAAHRSDAFDAARYGIDTLKDAVAIWKQEHWSDGGAHWPGVT
ncbi:MAG: molybdenum cofactor biosynthesis protein MoaE [Actinomycetota bacterium]|nr:molybdenum cofactor biosynthesis protein MoaE [Actinomycetota bacterium]